MMAQERCMVITPKQHAILVDTLKARFDAHQRRHVDIEWAYVQARLAANAPKLRTLHEMEESGGEPDVIGVDATSGECLFVDCCAQSPAGRRSLCYDRAALDARKANKPKGSAVELASS